MRRACLLCGLEDVHVVSRRRSDVVRFSVRCRASARSSVVDMSADVRHYRGSGFVFVYGFFKVVKAFRV